MWRGATDTPTGVELMVMAVSLFFVVMEPGYSKLQLTAVPCGSGTLIDSAGKFVT
jgi:hypothetical protein